MRAVEKLEPSNVPEPVAVTVYRIGAADAVRAVARTPKTAADRRRVFMGMARGHR